MTLLRQVLAAALLPASLGACVVLVRRLRRQPAALAIPAAFVLLVLHEAVLLCALSLGGWVTPWGVALGHVPLLVAAAMLLRGWRPRALMLGRSTVRGPEARWGLALLPIAALVIVSAAAYPPNTWDAMTYHLARVAHWVDHRSVLAYETWHPRQNSFPPGAAFLLLVPQVVADSDVFAPFVQLGCWLVLALSVPAWARLLGVPRRLAAIAGILVAAAPMAVLQASSTQYDLAAAVAALALARAALPFRNPGRVRLGDGALLGVALGAAWLVKSTAVIAAAPLVAWAGACALRHATAPGVLRRAAGPVLVAAGVPAATVALELLRRRSTSLAAGFDLALYVYPIAGEWADRAANVVRGIAHQLPVSALLAAISPALAPVSGAGIGAGAEPLTANEGLAGNPIQALLFLAAVGCAIACRGRVPARTRLVVWTSVASWVLLHVLARDNAWLSRLEFTLFPVGIAAVGALAPRGAGARAAPRWFLAVGVLCVAHGTWAAARNGVRPPTLHPPDRLDAMYAPLPQFRALDDAALRVAAARGCTRLGSRLAEPGWIPDPWDYPLVWRAHLAGISVRHVEGTEAWPCALYTLTEPPRRVEGPPWVWSGDELVFVPAN